MISISNLKNAGQAASYYEKDDYYVDKDCPSHWWGKGAEKLGLEGQVGRDDFRDIMNGSLPDGTEMPDYRGDRRPGLDLTFSAPKSVSLMALVVGDERIVEAHREAASRALDWLEKTAAQARVTEGGVTSTEATGNLVVARFDHDTSRELDPQLHTHSVVANATQRQDGEWRALSNEKLYDNRKAADAVYKAQLADKLRRIGYEIEQTHADGRFEIKGIGRDLIDHFSQRREQIESSLQERGLTSAKAAEVAALDTREAKKEVDRSQLRQEWKERARSMGMDLRMPRLWDLNPDLDPTSRMEAAREIAALGADHFSERASVFSHRDMVQFGLERGTGSTTLQAFENAISEMKEKGNLLDVGEGQYTTITALKLESEILNLAERGKGVFEPIMTEWKLRDAMYGSALTADQMGAAEAVLGSEDRVVGVQGYAGTGKTTMLRTVKELAEASGFEVRGFSNTATAANNLQEEAGIKSETLSLHLSRSQPPGASIASGKPRMWVVDEASMMGTSQCAMLLKMAERQDARVVLVGDRQQLPSIEAGKPFAILQDRGAMEVSTMKNIMRQEDQKLRAAVEKTIWGMDREALDSLKKDIQQVSDREARLKTVAEAYLSSDGSRSGRTIVITGMNVDRKELNNLIRAGLEERGVLHGEKAEGDVLVPRHQTKAELRQARTYQPGDVVRFGREYKSLGIFKGEYAEVESVDMEKKEVHLKTRDGRSVTWIPWALTKVELYEVEKRDLAAGDRIRWTRNERKLLRRNSETVKVLSVDQSSETAEVEDSKGRRQTLDMARQRHWEHGYASTVHAAQGGTAEHVIVHMDTNQKKVLGHESWYVSISRAKQNVLVFTDDLDQLPGSIKRIMGQESALEALEHHTSPTKQMEAPDGGTKSGPAKDLGTPSGERQTGMDRQITRGWFGLER